MPSPTRFAVAATVIAAVLTTSPLGAGAARAEGAPASPDVTAPTAGLLAPTGFIVDGAPMRLAWGGTDPAGAANEQVSGLASYDVRYRQATSITSPYSDWATPAAWQATTTTAGTLTVVGGVRTCVQVRAHDAAGNTGEWSSERCFTADSTPPTIVSASAGPLVVQAVAPTTVTFGYRATDDVQIASYDVYVRTAPLNGPLGGWTAPAGFVGRTEETAPYVVPVGGQACFAARGRDGVGHPSAWSDTRCAAVPVDDAGLRASGRVTRISTSVALAGTGSVLQSSGAELSLPTVQTGTQVGLVVLRGPGQGQADVYAGTVKLGRVYFGATAWRRDTVVLPVRAFSKATIRIRSTSAAQARIDAVAIIR